ncbi:hypothetical protein UY3_07841 [Chelonia mydas]|uniref:Uncharacterized protein n=1 Tax=Chelonia mydas TaxID=8469 RepID=M7C3H6_CHEMY|nr:hypothetical protein UY3_07841 [Chelonia mydas]
MAGRAERLLEQSGSRDGWSGSWDGWQSRAIRGTAGGTEWSPMERLGQSALDHINRDTALRQLEATRKEVSHNAHYDRSGQQFELRYPEVAAIAALRGSLSTPVVSLNQIRRRKKRTLDDMLSEILQASAKSDHEQKGLEYGYCRLYGEEQIGKRFRKRRGRCNRTKWGFSCSKHRCCKTLVDFQVQEFMAHFPLQSMENSTAASLYAPP